MIVAAGPVLDVCVALVTVAGQEGRLACDSDDGGRFAGPAIVCCSEVAISIF